jgi:hypothetical protein
VAGWAAGLVMVIPGLGGGRGKADVEAEGLELTDVTLDLLLAVETAGVPVGAEVGRAGFGFARRCQMMTRVKRAGAHLARRGPGFAGSPGPATPSHAGWVPPGGGRRG